MRTKRFAVLGAGGCAREVAWTLRETAQSMREFEFVGYLVSDVKRLGQYDAREEILGDFEWLSNHLDEIDGVVLGIGSPEVRARVVMELVSRFPRLEWPSVIHPDARLDRRTCSLGRGVVVCAGAIATVNVVLSDYVLVHYHCAISHETRIGRYSVLNPGAFLSGGVTVGESVMIGAGAHVLQYRTIAAGATVGAGAVVTKDVLHPHTVVGIPARPLSRTS